MTSFHFILYIVATAIVGAAFEIFVCGHGNIPFIGAGIGAAAMIGSRLPTSHLTEFGSFITALNLLIIFLSFKYDWRWGIASMYLCGFFMSLCQSQHPSPR